MWVNISSYTLPQFTDLVKRSFVDWLESLPQEMKNSGIVIDDTIPQNTWLFKRFAERLHRNQYAYNRDEGDIATQGKVQYGYEKDMQISVIALEISITKLMRVAGKNQDILDQVTTLTEVCPNTIDHDLALRLTFHGSSTYTDRNWRTVDVTVGDWNPLAYATHALTGSATTYNNIITWNPQFSKGALENAMKLFAEETYNNLWEKMSMKPDTLVTTDDPNTINQVRELLNATANVDTSNSGTFNVMKNIFKHVSSSRIATTAAWAADTTKRKYWFLASSRFSDFYLCMLEQPYVKTPADWNNWEEFSSENWNYLAAASYWIAIVTGRWIKCSTGLWV